MGYAVTSPIGSEKSNPKRHVERSSRLKSTWSHRTEVLSQRDDVLTEYEVLGQLSIISLHSGSWFYPSISSSKDQVPAPGHCRDCRITMQAEPDSLLGALHLALLANVTFVWLHFCLSYQVTVYGKEPALSYWCPFPSCCFSAGLM